MNELNQLCGSRGVRRLLHGALAIPSGEPYRRLPYSYHDRRSLEH